MKVLIQLTRLVADSLSNHSFPSSRVVLQLYIFPRVASSPSSTTLPEPSSTRPTTHRLSSPVSSSIFHSGTRDFSSLRKLASTFATFTVSQPLPPHRLASKPTQACNSHRVSFEIAATFSLVTEGPSTGEFLPNKTLPFCCSASSSTYLFMYCSTWNHVLSPTMLRLFCVVAFHRARVLFSPRNATNPPTKGLTPSPEET